MNSGKILIFLCTIWLCFLEGHAKKTYHTIEKSYAYSTQALLRLLDIEELLLENMNEYVLALKKKLNLAQRALAKFRAEESKMRANSETYFENPLNSFALIRHQHSDWLKWAEYMAKMVGKEQAMYASKMRKELPTSKDLKDASRGLETLIEYYKLKPSELTAGILPGHIQPSAALSSSDCYAMGRFNLLRKEYSKAEIWLKAALTEYSNKPWYQLHDFTESKIEFLLALSTIKQTNLFAGVEQLKAIKNTSSEQDGIIEEYDLMATFRRHCNARFYRPTKLHCRYNNWTSPFLRIAPLKMEELSREPLVVLYHDVMYNSEIEWFMTTKLDLKPAQLSKYEISPDRQAKDFFFHPNYHPITETIHRRVTDMSGFSMDGGDSLSFINYGIGGHYLLHFDTYTKVDITRGDRIATVLFYLGDVKLGGATILPELNLTIKPQRGSAVLWHNQENDGSQHTKTLHAACPVIVGAKSVLTKWVFDQAQMFIKPCQAI